MLKVSVRASRKAFLKDHYAMTLPDMIFSMIPKVHNYSGVFTADIRALYVVSLILFFVWQAAKQLNTEVSAFLHERGIVSFAVPSCRLSWQNHLFARHNATRSASHVSDSSAAFICSRLLGIFSFLKSLCTGPMGPRLMASSPGPAFQGRRKDMRSLCVGRLAYPST